jgi:uncharacterized UPF0160 family protein
MTIEHLITHSGAFHADDVFSYVILKDLFPKANLTRTRDDKIIQDNSETGITFDVGREFNPEKRLFDHHQPNSPLKEDGSPYSAFGLVWQNYGKEWLEKIAKVPSQHVEGTHTQFNENLVKFVDMVDNGQTPPNQNIDTGITAMVWRANPSPLKLDGTYQDVTEEEQTNAFLNVSQRVQPFLTDHAQDLAREEVTKSLVKQAITDQKSPALLILNDPLPWRGVIAKIPEAESVSLVVSPTENKKEWRLDTVPTTPNGFTPKRLLPKEWAGLAGEDLVKKTGVPSMHFCHNGQWIAIGSEKNAAIKLGTKTQSIWKEEDKSLLIKKRAAEVTEEKRATNQTSDKSRALRVKGRG